MLASYQAVATAAKETRDAASSLLASAGRMLERLVEHEARVRDLDAKLDQLQATELRLDEVRGVLADKEARLAEVLRQIEGLKARL